MSFRFTITVAALTALAPRAESLAAQASPSEAAGYRASFAAVETVEPARDAFPADAAYPIDRYAGRDVDGVPHYIERPFTSDERRVLRRQFGIEDPSRLYLADSTRRAFLNYDTERDPGAAKLVRTYRVGAPSIRLDGESWEALERRLRTLRPRDFPADSRRADTTVASLDPAARPHFRRMLADARRAGFRLRATEAYRSPERQAYLMVKGGGLTFTATSMHSAGRAMDIVVGDGNLRHARTRARWVAFRRWVAAYEGGRFRLIGEPGASWDWPHVELTEGEPGYTSIEALLRAAYAADTLCCSALNPEVHSSHDLARSGRAPVAGAGSGRLALRVDGAAGGPALPAR